MPREPTSNARPGEGRPPRIVHPFVVGLFPVASLLIVNLDEVALREAIVPAGLVLAASFILWRLLRAIIGDRHKRALVQSVCMLAFFLYGPFLDTLRGATGYHEMLGAAQVLSILALAVLVCGYPLYWFFRTPLQLAGLTQVLNRTCLAMIVLQGAMLLWGMARLEAYHWDAPQVELRPQSDSLPDIYYVILDMYTREDVLRESFGIDNAGFLDSLRERGFYVPGKARSNYPYTLLSLASSLNMKYLDDVALDYLRREHFSAHPQVPGMDALLDQGWQQEVSLIATMQDNEVCRALRGVGYRIVCLETGFSGTRWRSADVLMSPAFALTDFQVALIDTTPIRFVLNRMTTRWQYFLHHRKVLYVLEQLGKPLPEEGPHFVFAHLMTPHQPHSFDANGEGVYRHRSFNEGYRDSVAYLNKRLVGVVDDIIAHAPEAVIVLQGDHGPRLIYDDPEADRGDMMRDATAIFSAYRLPGIEQEKVLYHTISPVNTFRIIFNAYFDAGLSRLEDRNVLLDPDDPNALWVETQDR